MIWDLPTLVAVSVVLTAVLGALQLWLWRLDRSLVVLAIWGSAHLLGAAGLSMLAARGVLPTRVSIDVANAVVLLSYGLVWVGARRFEHRHAWIAIPAVGPAIWLVACQIPQFYPDLAYRTVLVSALIAGYDLLAMSEFLRRGGENRSPLRRGLATVFAMHAAIQAARVSGALVIGFDQAGFAIPSTSWFMVPAMAGLMLAMVASVLLIAAAKDDAQRQAIAAMREARDAAEQASVAKSRFLARISHELRTPLNSVLGMAQVLTRDPALTTAQHEQASLVEQAGRHLLAIVNDVLDLARAETGRLELFPTPVPVRSIVDVSMALVADVAAAGNVALRLQYESGTPAAVLADALRVRQILINLLGNAIKFTPPEGEVTLSVTRLAPQGGLRLSVLDTGPGVPAEIRPHLFQDFMFGPVSGATTDGTGMGLAISASLAQAMGGAIAYQPGPAGKGSLFVVDLPLGTAATPLVPPRTAPWEAKCMPAGTPHRLAPQTPRGTVAETPRGTVAETPHRLAPETPRGAVTGAPRVLVVDDVHANRRLVQVLLQQAGFAVDLAVDGASALTFLQQGPRPDVILMDVYMPGMDGLTTTRRVRRLPDPLGGIPIIALTADAGPDQIRACHQAGMDGYLAKPFNVQDLLDTINRLAPATQQIP